MATIEQLIRRAEKGVAKAQYKLGEIYECGRGVSKDELQAEKWYLKAAQQGDESSQVALALLYTLGGEKIPPNETEAVKWTLEAAKLGNAEMQCAMAIGMHLAQGFRRTNQNLRCGLVELPRKGTQTRLRLLVEWMALKE